MEPNSTQAQPTCQHCDNPVRWSHDTDQGFPGFIHLANGLTDCPEPVCVDCAGPLPANATEVWGPGNETCPACALVNGHDHEDLDGPCEICRYISHPIVEATLAHERDLRSARISRGIREAKARRDEAGR